jgi:hypothetical protein
VPEIVQNEVSKLRPAERAGEMAQLTMSPPRFTGSWLEMATFFEATTLLGA